MYDDLVKNITNVIGILIGAVVVLSGLLVWALFFK